MKLFPGLAAAAALTVATAAASADCVDVLRDGYSLRFPATRDAEPVKRQYLSELQEVEVAGAQPFCAKFEKARFYLQAGNFDLAIQTLNALGSGGDEELLRDNSVRLLLGQAYIQRSEFDLAVRTLRRETEAKHFEAMPTGGKAAVYSNLGYAYIPLGRYDKSLQFLQKAADLGSGWAAKNIVKVNSLLATLDAQPQNAPGIYAVVVDATDKRSRIAASLKKAADRLRRPADAFGVYLDGAGQYLIVLSPNVSYPAAKANRQAAEAAKTDEAYVVSTSQWSDVTGDFDA